MFSYPVTLTPDDNDTLMVYFPDLPGVFTYGDDEGEALTHAIDALETAISDLIARRQDIPAPSEIRGTHFVTPTLLGQLKMAVYAAMRGRGWRKADLARALDLNPRQIDRLLDLRHGSTVAQLEQALAACGVRADVATAILEPA